MHLPQGRWADALTGLALAVTVTALAAGERAAAARRTAHAVAAAGATVEGPVSVVASAAIIVGGLVGGLVLTALTLSRFRALLASEGTPWSGSVVRVWVAAGAAGVLFCLWQLIPAAGAAGLVLVALAAVVTAVLVSAPVLEGPSHLWRRTAVVALEVALLVLLFAVLFVLPFTPDQLMEVLRSWSDGSLAPFLAALAAALLLGAVVRASVMRSLDPANGTPGSWGAWGVVAAGVAIALALALMLLASAWVGAAAIVVGLVMWATTQWAAPMTVGISGAPAARRLAAGLSSVPLVLLLAALTRAAFDAAILPGDAGDDRALGAMALVVGLVITAVAAVALDQGPRWGLDGPSAVPVGLLAGAGAGWLAASSLAVPAMVPLLFVAGVATMRLFDERRRVELAAGAGVALGVAAAVYHAPVDAPRALGTFAVVLLATAGALSVMHALAELGARRAPRKGVPPLPSRVPVVTLLAFWFVVAGLAGGPTTRQARTAAAPEGEPPTVAEATMAWLERNATPLAAEHPGGARHYVPMVLVGASGGGSKAAYWTDLVLDCLLGEGVPRRDLECRGTGRSARRRLRRVFLTSSVSGGSVGVYHLLTRLRAIRRGASWVDGAGGNEVLSPIAAWGLFHDVPASLLGLDTDPRHCRDGPSCRLNADRALVQEAAVAHRGALAAPRNEPRLSAIARDRSVAGLAPPAIFNGAEDGGGARVTLSSLQLAPRRLDDPTCVVRQQTGRPVAGAVDGRDVLDKGEDVPLVTAALLSARFPLIAPPARLGDRSGGADCPRSGVPPRPLPPLKVRDGGYVENTGLLTITDVLPDVLRAVRRWRAQAPARRAAVTVQPIVLSIDDDPVKLDATAEVGERSAGRLGIGKFAGPGYLSSLARDRLTSCQYPGVLYRRLSPPLNPGARAATGWQVSETARRNDLGGALGGGEAARPQLVALMDQLRAILRGTDPRQSCGLLAWPGG